MVLDDVTEFEVLADGSKREVSPHLRFNHVSIFWEVLLDFDY